MNPLKRNSSRSPDGSNRNQRKISRVLPTDTERQRTSSINTNQVNATADPRLLRGSRGNALVQSPISTDGSAYQDAASNRATPQPQTAVMTAVGRPNDEGDTFKKQLLESLVALTTHITADASVSSSHDLARRRLDSATAEHQNMKDHFRKYPAIEERLSDEKDKAAKKVTKLEKQLELSVSSQSKAVAPLCETIWDLFSKAAAASRPESQRDAVTREEFEELQSRFQKQQDLIDEQQDRIKEQSTEMEEMRKTAKEANETSRQARDQAKTVSGDVITLQTRIGKIESSQSEQTDKQTFNELVAKVSRQKDDIERLATETAQNTSDLATKEDALTKLESATAPATSKLPVVQNEVEEIWKNIKETGKQPVVWRLKNHDQLLNNLSTKVKSAEERLGGLLQGLNKRPEDSEEQARLKQAEDKISNLARELSEVKEDARLKASGDAAAIVPAPVANSVPTAAPSNFNPAAFKQEVVEDIEEQTKTLAELLDEHDGQIEKLKEGLGSLTDKHSKLELEHDNEVRKRESRDQENNARHDTTSANYDLIQSEVTTFRTTTDTLRTDLESLSAAVMSLRDRPAQPPSAHPTNGIAVQQFRPVPVHSPQPPTPRTSISGLVQTNGVHPPNSALPPHQMANGTLAGPSNGEVSVTHDQIQGMWASIHSLQHRYDNLTTEDIVRAMVDQQSKMYPAPKEFQTAVNILQNVDKTFDAKLTSFETRLGSLEARNGSLPQNSAVSVLRNEFKHYATENNTHTNGRIQQLHNELAALRDGVKQLRTDIDETIADSTSMFDRAVDAQTNAITELRRKVAEFEQVAFGDNEDE